MPTWHCKYSFKHRILIILTNLNRLAKHTVSCFHFFSRFFLVQYTYIDHYYESGKQLQTGNFSRGDLKRRTGLRDAFVLFTEMNGPVSPDLTLLFVYKPDPHGLHTLKYAGTYFQFRRDIETKG